MMAFLIIALGMCLVVGIVMLNPLFINWWDWNVKPMYSKEQRLKNYYSGSIITQAYKPGEGFGDYLLVTTPYYGKYIYLCKSDFTINGVDVFEIYKDPNKALEHLSDEQFWCTFNKAFCRIEM